jgi:hypothetical protein
MARVDQQQIRMIILQSLLKPLMEAYKFFLLFSQSGKANRLMKKTVYPAGCRNQKP